MSDQEELIPQEEPVVEEVIPASLVFGPVQETLSERNARLIRHHIDELVAMGVNVAVMKDSVQVSLGQGLMYAFTRPLDHLERKDALRYAVACFPVLADKIEAEGPHLEYPGENRYETLISRLRACTDII